MVLTAAQTTSFFENADQMGVQHAAVIQLALEGIQMVDDLADFDKEALQQLAGRPGDRVPNPDPGAAAGSTISTPTFVFGAKSQKHLVIACELVRYYNTVGRDLTAVSMRWNNIIKNFEIQWKALKTKRDEDTPDVPKISKSLPIIKWTEAFQDHDKEALQQLAGRPGGRVPNPDPGAAAGSTIPTPAFVFGAKSQKRLGIACELVRYYNTVGRDLTAVNMRWNNIIKTFEIQWKALKTKRDEDTPDVPKISKSLPIIKWTEAFQDHLHCVIGVRMILLAYVTRKDEGVPAVAPPLLAGQPHSKVHGSIEGEMIARALHTHVMFRDDNGAVYYALEEATRSMSYAASIKPLQRT